MNKCLRCQVTISADHENCPLCHAQLTDKPAFSLTAYPEYPLKNDKKKYRRILRY